MNISLQTLNPHTTKGQKPLPCLVLLHGWGFHCHAWPPTWLLALQQQFCVVVVDLPGHGDAAIAMNSDNASAMQANAMPWLKAFTQQLVQQLPEKFHLMGWSLGGQVAMYIACQYPQRIQSLVSLAANPCFLAAENHHGMDALELAQFTQLYHTHPAKTLARFCRLQSQGAIQSSCRAVLQAQVQVVNGQVLGLHWLAQLDLRRALLRIPCHALYAFAQADALVPVAVMQSMQRYLPSNASMLQVAGCHGLPFEYATPSGNNNLWHTLEQHWQTCGANFAQGNNAHA